MDEKQLERIRKEYIEIAQQLCYSLEVIKKLSQAKSEMECDRIMVSARRGQY